MFAMHSSHFYIGLYSLYCHDLAKQLKGNTGKYHITSVTQSQSHHMMSHDRSHDRHRKEVHRPYSSCISSVENLMGTLLSSLCQSLNKEQLALFQFGV